MGLKRTNAEVLEISQKNKELLLLAASTQRPERATFSIEMTCGRAIWLG
jgi:hypothetical protein